MQRQRLLTINAIMSYVLLSEPEIAAHRPKVVLVDAQNKIRDVIDYEPANTVL